MFLILLMPTAFFKSNGYFNTTLYKYIPPLACKSALQFMFKRQINKRSTKLSYSKDVFLAKKTKQQMANKINRLRYGTRM